MRSLRQWHHYISLFFGPAIFFFALSGFIQVTGFHEAHPGSTYKPAEWLVALSSLHKHQTLDADDPDMHEQDHDADAHEKDMDRDGDESFVLLKPFALLTALGFMVSSLLGMAIALTNPAVRRTSLILIIAGILAPVLLLAL